jgi:hypothetical protein
VWSCRIALAAVFLSAAVAKARNLPALREYLEPVFHSFAKPAGWVAVAGETCVALLLIAWDAPVSGWVAVAAVALVTAFYAVRLCLANGVRCACWGPGGPQVESPSLRSAALYPALAALRNGLLAGAAVVASTSSSRSAIEPRYLIPRILLAIVGAQAIVLAGLIVSIARKHFLLGDPQHHPLTAVYAARWARVRGCRSVDFS